MPSSRLTELDTRVLAVLREHGQVTHVQIARSLGVDRSGIRLSLARLQQRGLGRFVGVTDGPRKWGEQAPDSVWEAVTQPGE